MIPILPVLVLAGAGFFALASSSSSPASSQSRLRNWTGRVGPLAFNVKRMGAGWAWYVESVGSGSEPSAKLALQQALRAAIESGKLGRGDGWHVTSDTDTVVAEVSWNAASGGGDEAWSWSVSSSADDIASGPGDSRGTATLLALDTLEPFTDGSA